MERKRMLKNSFYHLDTNGDGKVSDEDSKCIWNSREKNLMALLVILKKLWRFFYLVCCCIHWYYSVC